MSDKTLRPEDVRVGNVIIIAGNKQVVKSIEFDEEFKPLINSFVIEACSGIPLTPELLERCGFERGDNVTSNDSFYCINVGISELAINPDNGVVWISNNVGSFNNPALVDYFHSLQNLYFALTGKELTLTP